jgi:zinc protease
MTRLRALPFTILALALALAACGSRSVLPAPQQPLSATPSTARTAPPHEAPVEAAPAVPPIQAFKLDNGLAVYVLEQHGHAHVALAYVSLRGGEDPADLEVAGLASVIQEALLVPSDDADDKASAPAPGGAPDAKTAAELPNPILFSSAVLRHVAFVSTRVETAALGRALNRLSNVVLRPELTEKGLSRARKRARWSWDEERYGALGIIRNHLMQRIYGPAHVLGQHADMAVKRVDKHALEAVRKGYEARYAPSGSAIVIVGDVRADAALELVKKRFGGWRNDAPAPPAYAPSDWEPRGKRKVFLGGSSQSYLVVGQRAPAPGSADYAATELLTEVLGGPFASRLHGRLRTHDGLAYYTAAHLDARRDGSTLMLETSVQPDHTREALAAMLEEMTRLQVAPVPPDELDRARRRLITAELASYETSVDALAQIVYTLELGGDPSRVVGAHVEALNAIDPAALQQAARRVLDPQKSPVIIMGDLSYAGDLAKWARRDDETF